MWGHNGLEKEIRSSGWDAQNGKCETSVGTEGVLFITDERFYLCPCTLSLQNNKKLCVQRLGRTERELV